METVTVNLSAGSTNASRIKIPDERGPSQPFPFDDTWKLVIIMICFITIISICLSLKKGGWYWFLPPCHQQLHLEIQRKFFLQNPWDLSNPIIGLPAPLTKSATSNSEPITTSQSQESHETQTELETSQSPITIPTSLASTAADLYQKSHTAPVESQQRVFKSTRFLNDAQPCSSAVCYNKSDYFYQNIPDQYTSTSNGIYNRNHVGQFITTAYGDFKFSEPLKLSERGRHYYDSFLCPSSGKLPETRESAGIGFYGNYQRAPLTSIEDEGIELSETMGFQDQKQPSTSAAFYEQQNFLSRQTPDERPGTSASFYGAQYTPWYSYDLKTPKSPKLATTKV